MPNYSPSANTSSTNNVCSELQLQLHYSLQPSEVGLIQLKQLSILDVVGTDAIDFLQSILSNDVQHLRSHEIRCACLCSPKGRVIATFDYWLQPVPAHGSTNDFAEILPGVRLLMAADMRHTVYHILKRFILRRKVKLVIPPETLILSFVGAPEQLFSQITPSVRLIPNEQQIAFIELNLTAIKNTLFENGHSQSHFDKEENSQNCQIMEHDTVKRFRDVVIDGNRFARVITLIEPLILHDPISFYQQKGSDPSIMLETESTSPPRYKLLDEKYWDRLAIHAGQVSISATTSDQFIPQMINFEITGGIDFKKGCYPGQEIVARSQYRGTVKRRTQRAYALHAEVGQDVFAFASEITQAEICGRVLMTAPVIDGGVDCLIEINKSFISSKHQFYVQELECTLNLKDLPYLID